MIGKNSPLKQEPFPGPSSPEKALRRLEEGGPSLAFRFCAATRHDRPTIIFCGGFRSDMTGTKAHYLDALACARGWGMICFDYRGHGASEGRFTDGSISLWRDDTMRIIRHCLAPSQPVLLVGSSMGGWIMILAALLLEHDMPGRVAGLVGVAAAPDFTKELIEPVLDAKARAELEEKGMVFRPSDYGDPDPITRLLIEDGAHNLVLGGPIPLSCPVRLLHGIQDEDVPWNISMRLASCLAGEDVIVTLVKDGDHRLSRDEDLARLGAACDEIMAFPCVPTNSQSV